MDRGASMGSGKSQMRLKRLSKHTLRLKAYHAGLVTLSGLKRLLPLTELKEGVGAGGKIRKLFHMGTKKIRTRNLGEIRNVYVK